MDSKSWSEVLTNLSNLFPWLTQYHQAQELALKAEASVRRLSGLPPASSDEHDIISVLQHTCSLLDRLVENPELLQTDLHKQTPIIIETTTTTEEVLLPTVEAPVPPEIIPEAPTLKIAPEPKLSATGEELIKLRDWVLLAQTGGSAPNPELLAVLSEKLGQILAKEGVIPIEDSGIFNYERQQVISTQATDDPEKKDCVCETVRPGYLFNGKLIRPQEVIIYTFDASTSSKKNRETEHERPFEEAEQKCKLEEVKHIVSSPQSSISYQAFPAKNDEMEKIIQAMQKAVQILDQTKFSIMPNTRTATVRIDLGDQILTITKIISQGGEYPWEYYAWLEKGGKNDSNQGVSLSQEAIKEAIKHQGVLLSQGARQLWIQALSGKVRKMTGVCF